MLPKPASMESEMSLSTTFNINNSRSADQRDGKFAVNHFHWNGRGLIGYGFPDDLDGPRRGHSGNVQLRFGDVLAVLAVAERGNEDDDDDAVGDQSDAGEDGRVVLFCTLRVYMLQL